MLLTLFHKKCTQGTIDGSQRQRGKQNRRIAGATAIDTSVFAENISFERYRRGGIKLQRIGTNDRRGYFSPMMSPLMGTEYLNRPGDLEGGSAETLCGVTHRR